MGLSPQVQGVACSALRAESQRTFCSAHASALGATSRHAQCLCLQEAQRSGRAGDTLQQWITVSQQCQQRDQEAGSPAVPAAQKQSNGSSGNGAKRYSDAEQPAQLGLQSHKGI